MIIMLVLMMDAVLLLDAQPLLLIVMMKTNVLMIGALLPLVVIGPFTIVMIRTPVPWTVVIHPLVANTLLALMMTEMLVQMMNVNQLVALFTLQ
jgi:hypothetical protein